MAKSQLFIVRKNQKPQRLTPELLTEIMRNHMSCVHDQEHRCPLLISVSSLCWEINQACNIGNEEDRGFRRTHVDGLCAARPLNPERFDDER